MLQLNLKCQAGCTSQWCQKEVDFLAQISMDVPTATPQNEVCDRAAKGSDSDEDEHQEGGCP